MKSGPPNRDRSGAGVRTGDMCRVCAQTPKTPGEGDKAIMLGGKHRGQHVTVLSVDASTQLAIVKVERMTNHCGDFD